MADAKDRYSDARQHPLVDGSRRARKLALARRGQWLVHSSVSWRGRVVRGLRAGR
jgi:hypothetical protein